MVIKLMLWLARMLMKTARWAHDTIEASMEEPAEERFIDLPDDQQPYVTIYLSYSDTSEMEIQWERGAADAVICMDRAWKAGLEADDPLKNAYVFWGPFSVWANGEFTSGAHITGLIEDDCPSS